MGEPLADDFASSATQPESDAFEPAPGDWANEPGIPPDETHSMAADSGLFQPAPVVGGPWPPAMPSQSAGDLESFRMPPLLLELSYAEAEQFREDFLDHLVPGLNKLLRECIASEFSHRDFVQAAEMRALYW